MKRERERPSVDFRLAFRMSCGRREHRYLCARDELVNAWNVIGSGKNVQ